MEHHVRSELNLLDDEDDEPDAVEEIALHYRFSTALFLWTAWRKHGKTPLGGGLLDQPKTWKHDMEQLNLRYGITLKRLLPEMKDKLRRTEPESDDPFDSLDYIPTQRWEDMGE
jgi:hypothetical protein